ncbi:MAG: SDR family NAD(P)-dependent oxidoreductase [Pirellulales bacterium]
MKVELQGQVAVVTGAARGIGRAIADKLADNGAITIYTDIDEAAVLQAAKDSPGQSHAAVMNVANELQVKQVVVDLIDRYSKIDILINNAGVNTLEHRVTIDEFPKEEWDRLLNIDLTGLFLVSKEVAKRMKLAKSGRIINIASIVGLVPLRLQCAFTAAKAGVINLSKAMAIELGNQGILVNAIAPGSIVTEGTKKLFYSEEGTFRHGVQDLMDHIPLGRPGQVEDVAHTVLFLAAPQSSYITGTVLTVDGGWTAGYSRNF